MSKVPMDTICSIDVFEPEKPKQIVTIENGYYVIGGYCVADTVAGRVP